MSRKKIHPRWAHRFQPSRKTWFPWNQLWNDMLNGDLYWFIFLWGTVRRTSSSCLRVSSAANASRPTLSWRSIWTSTRPKTTRCPTSASTARNGFRTRRSRSRTATRCTPTRATSSAISAAKRFPLLFTRALGKKKVCASIRVRLEARNSSETQTCPLLGMEKGIVTGKKDDSL